VLSIKDSQQRADTGTPDMEQILRLAFYRPTAKPNCGMACHSEALLPRTRGMMRPSHSPTVSHEVSPIAIPFAARLCLIGAPPSVNERAGGVRGCKPNAGPDDIEKYRHKAKGKMR
jgi:hypothetical protein